MIYKDLNANFDIKMRQNVCIKSVNAFAAAVAADNNYAFLALNVNLTSVTTDKNLYNAQTFSAAYYTNMYSQLNHTTVGDQRRIYTSVNCATDASDPTKYLKQYIKLDQDDAANVSLDTTIISSVNHPLNTIQGFDQCVVKDVA